jgi:NitT/TauT family transport system substrate-binding protein
MKKYVYSIIIFLMLVTTGFTLYERSHFQKSLYVVSMTADEMSAALKNGSISGFISWEPYPSKAVSNGYAKYLINSSDAWENHPSLVLAISEDMTDEDMIRALVWAEVKSTRFINNHSNFEKVLDYDQEFLGLDRLTVLAAINNTVYSEYPDLNETRRAIEIISKAGFIKKDISSIGYSNVDDFLSKVYINKYYNEVKKKLDEDPNWIPPRVNGNIRFGYIEGSSLNLAMYIAEKEGYFEKSGLVTGKNIQFIGYRSGRAMIDAFMHREIDAGTLGTTVLLGYKINDNGRIHIVSGVNSGGTSLVVRADSDIRTIGDLNGKTIATPGFGTCQDTIMRKMFGGFEIKTQ